MKTSYKILYILMLVAQVKNMQAEGEKEPSRSASENIEYQDYVNTIKNNSEKDITIKVNYSSGKVVGPIPLPMGSAMMLNEDFSDISNVVVSGKEFTQCTQKGRLVKLPTKTKYSMISYLEDKKGGRLVIQ